MIYERASLGFLSPPTRSTAEGIIIGDGVIIESGALVEAASIGSHTIIEARAKIGKEAVIGDYCKICSGVVIGEKEVLAGGTVVWGSRWDQRRSERGEQEDKSRVARKLLVDGLNQGTRAIWSAK